MGENFELVNHIFITNTQLIYKGALGVSFKIRELIFMLANLARSNILMDWLEGFLLKKFFLRIIMHEKYFLPASAAFHHQRVFSLFSNTFFTKTSFRETPARTELLSDIYILGLSNEKTSALRKRVRERGRWNKKNPFLEPLRAVYYLGS